MIRTKCFATFNFKKVDDYRHELIGGTDTALDTAQKVTDAE